MEARPPAEKTQPPTPPPARPVAQESPGQQLVRMALGVKGPPTPSQFNGSVTGMEVDDTRANQTYHSNDETEPLSMSQGQKIVHALSTKIHMSDLARRQNVGLNELSGKIISPVQLENSNRDEFSSPVGMHQAQTHLHMKMDNMSLDATKDGAKPEAKALPIAEETLNANVSSNTGPRSVANGATGTGASEMGIPASEPVKSSTWKELNRVVTESGETVSTVAVNIHISVKTGQKRVAEQRPMSKTMTVQPIKKKGCSRVSPQAWLELKAKLHSYGEAQEGSVRRHLPTAAELCATGISDTALFGPGLNSQRCRRFETPVDSIATQAAMLPSIPVEFIVFIADSEPSTTGPKRIVHEVVQIQLLVRMLARLHQVIAQWTSVIAGQTGGPATVLPHFFCQKGQSRSPFLALLWDIVFSHGNLWPKEPAGFEEHPLEDPEVLRVWSDQVQEMRDQFGVFSSENRGSVYLTQTLGPEVLRVLLRFGLHRLGSVEDHLDELGLLAEEVASEYHGEYHGQSESPPAPPAPVPTTDVLTDKDSVYLWVIDEPADVPNANRRPPYAACVRSVGLGNASRLSDVVTLELPNGAVVNTRCVVLLRAGSRAQQAFAEDRARHALLPETDLPAHAAIELARRFSRQEIEMMLLKIGVLSHLPDETGPPPAEAVDRYYVQYSRKSLRIAEEPAQPPMTVVERHPFGSQSFPVAAASNEQMQAACAGAGAGHGTSPAHSRRLSGQGWQAPGDLRLRQNCDAARGNRRARRDLRPAPGRRRPALRTEAWCPVFRHLRWQLCE